MEVFHFKRFGSIKVVVQGRIFFLNADTSRLVASIAAVLTGSTIASNRVWLLICVDCNVAQPTLISFDIFYKTAVFVSL